MKRIVIYGLLACLTAIFLWLWHFVSDIAVNPDSIRTIFRLVSENTDAVKLDVEELERIPNNGLKGRGLKVTWPEGYVYVREFEIFLQGRDLILGIASVKDVNVRGFHVQDDSADIKTPYLLWPVLTKVPKWLDIRVARGTAEGLSYRFRKEKPLEFPPFSIGPTTWRESVVRMQNGTITLLDWQYRGDASLDFNRPGLTLDCKAAPLNPRSAIRELGINAILKHTRTEFQGVGSVNATLTLKNGKRLEAAAESELSPETLSLGNLTLRIPGEKTTATGDALLDFSKDVSKTTVRITKADFDLPAYASGMGSVTGNATVVGGLDGYTGRVSLRHANDREKWQGVNLEADLSGNASQINLKDIDALFAGGKIKGNLQIAFLPEWDFSGTLQGRNLNPALMNKDWAGVVNLDLNGRFNLRNDSTPYGRFQASFPESRLHGRTLTAGLSADLSGDDLNIEQFVLKGKGFDIQGQGRLKDRIAFTADIDDLGGLIPQASGSLGFGGWLRYAVGTINGQAEGNGRNISLHGFRMNGLEFSAALLREKEEKLNIILGVSGGGVGKRAFDRASMKVAGSPGQHNAEISFQAPWAGLRASFKGGWRNGQWTGEISSLEGKDQAGQFHLTSPSTLKFSPRELALAEFSLSGTRSERLKCTLNIGFSPFRGTVRGEVKDMALNRLNQWLDGYRLEGSGSGTLRLESLSLERADWEAELKLSGKLGTKERMFDLKRAEMRLEGSARGQDGQVKLEAGEELSFKARYSSRGAARLALPQDGVFSAEWKGIDPALLTYGLLPADMKLEGMIVGNAEGRFYPGSRFDLKGASSLKKGRFLAGRRGRTFEAGIRKAEIAYDWRENSLLTQSVIELAENGRIKADLQLPLPAHLPAALLANGELKGEVKAKLNEKGLLTAMFPGLVQDSASELGVEAEIGGTWKEPMITAKGSLSQDAYLPAAGIHLKNLSVNARLQGERLHIDNFGITSGNGFLSGNAALDFNGFKLARYSGRIKGERFQAVYLPELRVTADPDLAFEGSMNRFSCRGEIRVPELVVYDASAKPPVPASKDVVVIRESAAAGRDKGYPALDIKVKVILGENVLVRSMGLDVALEGGVNLSIAAYEDIRASGEIRVSKGKYNAYGVNLEVRKGRVVFGGGPVEEPSLDVLAVKEVDDATVGVAVVGTPAQPVVKFYSSPAMPDVDVLSYIVFGRPFSSQAGGLDMLIKASSLFASPGKSRQLLDTVKERLGLDTLEVGTEGKRAIGYRPIETSASTREGKNADNSSISKTMLHVGKYLTPKLYVSFGMSLFGDNRQFLMRYNLSKHLEAETRAGTTASGGDLFYKIEFN